MTDTPIHVLHVNDDLEFMETAAEFLERAAESVSVETATTAAEGIERLQASAVDCVVSDYDIGDMDGIAFLEAVRAEYPDLPFILYTGKGSEEIASEAISAGVTDYLQKGPGSSQYEILFNRIENAVEQRRTRVVAAETEQRLRTIAENSNDVLWMFTADWNELLFVNSPYETVWGRSTEELGSDPSSFLDGVHPDDRERVRAAMDRLSAGESIDIEYRVNAAEDFSRWVWVQGDPVFEGGEVTRVVGFARDVTDWKARERELERYEVAVETARDGVAIWDADGIYRLVNDAFVEGVGMPEEEILGQQVGVLAEAGIIGTETIESGTEAAMDLLMNDEDQVTFEATIDSPTHGEMIVEVNLALRPPGPDDDWVGGAVATMRPITPRKLREEELERQNERLEEFASVVSHDLRNPLNVAQGRLQLAREEHDSEHLSVVGDALDRSQAMIDDLLTLARQGQSVSELETVALDLTVRRCWQTVETRGATLTVETDRSILADMGRLQQLLENLVRNGVEHGGDGVTVTVGELDDGFYVADDGPGIPDGERDRIFESGYTTADAGTGFGLAIVQEIADAHGWQLRVTESDAGGARFEITGVEVVKERADREAV